MAGPARRGCRGLVPAAFLLALGAGGARAGAEVALFEVLELRVPGRAIEVVPARLGLGASAGAPGGSRDLLVVAAEGTPPEEARRLVAFAPDARGRPSTKPAWTLDVPPEVAAFDVGPVQDRAPGAPEPSAAPDAIVLLAADRVEIVRPGAAGGVTRRPLAPPAPLPPRVRGVSRMPILGDWNTDGRAAALVPALGGARIVGLANAGDRERVLAFPVYAEYVARGPGPPAQDEWLHAELTWPVLERADEDGDGRADLFALQRFEVSVHRAGPDGLATLPARSHRLRPFTAAEELRPRATSLRMRALDLDADGRAEIVVHRNAGTLLNSRALTEVFWNRGPAGFAAQADLRREESGALVTCDPIDLDADGRSELVETRVAFGIVQMARVLATRRIELDVRVVAIAPDAPPRTTWTGALGLALDFAQARVVGLVPTAEGDWNGDGRKDALYGTGSDGIAIRLGVATPEGPGFGEVAGAQRVRAEGHAVVVDMDGDGLDDLVVHDPMDDRGVVRVLRNLGQLPGTPPALRAAKGR